MPARSGSPTPTILDAEHPAAMPRGARIVGPVGLALLTSGCIGGLASIGLPEGMSPAIGALSAFLTIVEGSFLPLAYMLGAMGIGRVVLWMVTRGGAGEAGASGPRHALQLALGLAVMLVVTQLLGIAGLLSGSGPRPLVAAWMPVALGLVLLIDQVVRGSLRPERWPVVPRGVMVMAPGLSVMLVAAASAPGWLWGSEYGGYDALSYHLQLPKEWITRAPEGVGRLWPVEHNVYSFLPSYFEGAFLHLGAMQPGGGSASPLGLESEKLIWGEGTWLASCQLLHALCAVAAAYIVARLTRVVIERMSEGEGARAASRPWHREVTAAAPVIAAGVCIATPWAIVTGSMAYNEMAMLALFAGALLAAVEPGLRPWARGTATGLLVGAACSVKPTAMFMCAPVAALALAMFTRRRDWVVIALFGAAAGVAVMLPWLIRNYAACGNPIFPFAAGWFGSAHWTAADVEKYLQNHHAQESVLERSALLFSSRGVAHAQWALVPMIGAVCAGLLALRPATRKLGVWLGASLVVQVVAWILFTHVQSRFLLPLLVPSAVAVGAAANALLAERELHGQRKSLHRLRFGLVAPLLLGAWSVALFLGQHGQQPNRLLVSGAMLLSGAAHEDRIYELAGDERQRYLGVIEQPAPLINLAIQPEVLADSLESAIERGRVYLLGDAAALYYLAATGGPRAPVVYHTTWDRSPLGDAIEAHPGDPRTWARGLAAGGFEFVLASASELERLVTRDRYFDERVTAEHLVRLFRETSGLTLVRAWPDSGHALYRIEGFGGAGAADDVDNVPDVARRRRTEVPEDGEAETR